MRSAEHQTRRRVDLGRGVCGRRRGWAWLPALLGLWIWGVGFTAEVWAADDRILVSTRSIWSFRKGTSEASTPAELWRQLTFDDGTWALGVAPFFYDTDGVYTGATHLADMRNGYTSVYLRSKATASEVAAMGALRLRFLCDDGFVLWVNGRYVTNFNKSPDNVAFNAVASGNAAEPLEWREMTVARPDTWLRDGVNQLAVQVFNTSRSSSDLMFEMELAASARDNAPPSIAEVTPAPGTAGDLRSVTVTFSEPVQGVGFSDLLLNERPAVGVSGGGSRYTFAFDPPAPGPVAMTWDPGAGIVDLADPPNRFDTAAASARWSYVFVDATPPGILDVTPAPETTVRALGRIEVRFSEPVAGVDAADLRVNGVGADSVVGSGAGPYVFEVPVPGSGLVRVAWEAGHGIRDLAVPANPFAGGEWRYTVDPALETYPVRINEILAGNLGETGLRDEDDAVVDWIELENRGSTEVNLRGWSLTDDPADPGKWVFPETRVGPGSFVVVFASAKDRRPAGPGLLHTNFKLGAGGGYLGLYNAESPRAVVSGFAPAYPPQRADMSYGFDPGGRHRYFATPSPGRANGTSAIDGVLPAVDVNVARGVFERGFDLVLSTPVPGAEIRYTLDGGEPAGAGAQAYRGPLRVEGTTVLRTAAFRAGYVPSVVSTHTYVFPASAARQPANPPGVPPVWIDTQGRSWEADYGMDPEIVDSPVYRDRVVPSLKALPVLSIVTRPADMFDNANGIYPKSQARGPSWERPGSVEILDWERGESVQVDCGVQMQGNSVRDPVKTGKHAFRLVFKGEYGAPKLRYRVFPDSPLEEYDTLTVRADFNNSWMHWNGAQRPQGQRVRDAWMKESQRAMGGLASRSRFFHLHVNGLYWGVYDAVERPDAAFAASHLGGAKEEFDVVNEGQLVDGSMTAYNAMRAVTGLEAAAGYDRMRAYLDVPAYIDYLLLHFYTGHEDWFTDKNWYATRRRVAGAGFRYHAWDGELMLNSPTHNIVTRTDQPSGLHGKMLVNSQYRMDFADRVQRHLFGSGALTPGQAWERYARWADLVEPAMVAESARWGDYRRDVHAYQSGPYELYTVDGHFRAERERLRTRYFPGRTATLLAQLKAAGLYPSNVAAPVFATDGGPVPPGFRVSLQLPEGTGTVLYTVDGTDPRVPHTGVVAPSARTYSGAFPLEVTTLVRARTRSGSDWSALAEARYDIGVPGLSLLFTEIHYHPVDGDPYEFLEVQNRGALPVDVGGFAIQGVDYLFPRGTVLEPDRVWVVASDRSPGSFAARHPGVRVDGWFAGTLSDGGERVALVDREGRTVESVDFRDRDGWPRQADGLGPSLERVDVVGDPDAAGTWRASARSEGTPGVVVEQGAAPPGVRFAEVMAAGEAGEVDWVELENPGTSAVEVGGWGFSDAGSGVGFVLPTGTVIAPGARRLIWCPGSSATLPGPDPGRWGWEARFGLAAGGETVVLTDAAGVQRDVLTFGMQLRGTSLGRVGVDGEWRLCEPTPGESNRAQAMVDASALVLNEWRTDAPPGEGDWIEVYNRDLERPVSLRGLWLSLDGVRHHRLGAWSFLAPGGHAVLRADEQPGPDHIDFRLPAAGGVLELIDPSGLAVDRVELGVAPEGVSRGRWPDGGQAIETFTGTSSPGLPNQRPGLVGPQLNELLAWPAGTGDSDGSGTGSGAWVELWHPGGAAWPLGGLRIRVPGPSGATVDWVFPTGSGLPDQGYAVVGFDGERPAGSDEAGHWNTGLPLPRDGGDVVLVAADGRELDRVRYGFQVPGRSVGRVGNSWALLRRPTPGTANAEVLPLGTPEGIRVNEWMAAPSTGEDWFELHNRGSGVVSLSGWSVSDHPGLSGRRPWSLGPLSFIDAGGFVRILADGRDEAAPNHAGFQLAAGGESLVVMDATGQWVDAVFFGRQVTDVSQGRLPDGGDGPFHAFARPTPGLGNAIAVWTAPRITGVASEGGFLRLRIEVEPGMTYRLDSSPDLTRWQERQRDRPAATPWDVRVPVGVAGAGEFFRIVLEP